ncbi:MAG: ribonuclease HI family protein [Bdellovibrionaceae bacterium]|nr:ribonuclease HI family protein [Bdellovibrionales bacterium]MCB9253426.1 ribonuclease HI family protein [Pseudobdellovibrionaceae bacterium]
MGREFVLYCDGAARGNPGPAAFGYVILEGDEKVAEAGECLGIATNNVAEYKGLIHGLRHCLELGAAAVRVRTDSELMTRQLNGQYKVKSPHLVPLFQEARELLRQFQNSQVEHVRREHNKDADAMANKALDKKI